MTEIRTCRLTPADRDVARAVFALMEEVFEGDGRPLSDGYLDRLLRREDFWAVAAFVDGQIVGGLTAHTLPMTRSEESEVFIYDVAVRGDVQRRGVGRQLMRALCDAAAAAGITNVFVPADDEDMHALEFYRAIGGDPAPVTIFTFDRRR